jgi:hypothetical protein
MEKIKEASEVLVSFLLIENILFVQYGIFFLLFG